MTLAGAVLAESFYSPEVTLASFCTKTGEQDSENNELFHIYIFEY